ncbi:alpha,alpha-trehalase [Candidatus Saccharibacteria bacterium]|nr:alpha,alpha-trehalase [Candidatus Saccharibacteria bacterium]
MSENDVEAARTYIHDYWPKLTRRSPKDDESLIGQPHPYLVPAFEEGHEFDFNELYYWDSYFMCLGIMDEEHKELVVGILEDLLSMFERYKIIPNASRTYLMGRSQPPFLTSFILDVYKAYKMDKAWLKRAINIAQREYQTVWMGTSKPNARQVYEGLSRYYDINYLHDLAEAESGWDMNPRFGRKCLNFLPVDLNSLLYKYERDFAYAERILGQETEAVEWEKVARRRKEAMNKLMWSELRVFYYDYDYTKKRRGNVDSLAAYFTLWAGIASEKQAAKLVKSLRKFEQKGGLATTDQQFGQLVPGALPTQWAYPNGWAPLQYIVVSGLRRYGYHKEAQRIAFKWVGTNLKWFKKHGVFLEKYNVVQPNKPPVKGVYPSQTGFGWTNSIFELFCKEFIDKKE